jgi:CheY-like chemotaxis protein
MVKVMLVEDDPIMIDLLNTLLELEGFEVSTLSSGENFIKTVKNDDPDLILLDVHLRGLGGAEINGFDLLKQIRSDATINNCTVVMSSGMDFKEKSKQNNADGFILKPYMPGDLVVG